LCLLAAHAGGETVVDIARFGQKKIELLHRLLPFRDGTPSLDQRGDILATLDGARFQRRFVAWVAKLIDVSPDVIAIDGKTSRRSADKRKGKAAIHVVSAFAARQGVVLGQSQSGGQNQPAWTSTVEPQHVGVHAGLVDKCQLGGVKQTLLAVPLAARPYDVLALLFSGVQAFLLAGDLMTIQETPQRGPTGANALL
jgi:DDE_Tnp_1-associated